MIFDLFVNLIILSDINQMATSLESSLHMRLFTKFGRKSYGLKQGYFLTVRLIFEKIFTVPNNCPATTEIEGLTVKKTWLCESSLRKQLCSTF